MPKSIDFASYADSWADPPLLISDFAKFDRPLQFHVAFQGLNVFKIKNGGRLPLPRNEHDAIVFLGICKELAGKLSSPPELDEKLIKEFSYQCCFSYLILSSWRSPPIECRVGWTGCSRSFKGLLG
jgi:ubiquitin-activating enzyme E1